MNKILTFCAAGPITGPVIPELAKRNAFVRAFVREHQAPLALHNGATEVALGDLTDSVSVKEALQGIDSVFYIAPLLLADQAAVGRRIVEQAIEAGVKRFVFSSIIHPILSSLPNHTAKAPVEERILDSDLEFVFLHPTILYQNYAQAWQTILNTGVVAEPWSNETHHSRVDYRDVAEVAAIALTEDRLTNGTFELCADTALNRHDVAAMISEVTGRPIVARQADPKTFGPLSDLLRPMFEHYDRYGLRGNALILRTILGREPRTLRAYFEELMRKP